MNSRAVPVAMLAPAIFFYVLGFAAPLAIAIRLSFFESNYVFESFVGLKNYLAMFGDRYFRTSFINSFIFVGMITPPLVIVPYWIASLLSEFGERFQSAVRFILYLPALVSGVVIALLWRWMLHGDGLVNGMLASLGLPGIPWLTEAWPARFSVAMISVMGGIGGTVLIFAAAIHGLNPELRDAARIDGASERQYKRHIMRPMMMPIVLLVVLLNIVGIMQIWELSYVLFQSGGPEGATASPVYEIFMTAFMFAKQGYAAAKGIALTLVIAAILIIKRKVERWAGY